MRRIGLVLVMGFFFRCSSVVERPVIFIDSEGRLELRQRDSVEWRVALVDIDSKDTTSFVSGKGSSVSLECGRHYLCFLTLPGNSRFSFLDSVSPSQRFCEDSIQFEQVFSDAPKLGAVLQDFKKGSIYGLGKHGALTRQLERSSGYIRGFDVQDSLVAWCSDSSTISIKNIINGRTDTIFFGEATKLHHDLILSYPNLSVLFNRRNYESYHGFNIIEDGFITINLLDRTKRIWSTHDFLADSLVPPENAKGEFLNTHSNSIDIDENGDYYISFRDFNQVWKISSDMKTVMYRIGKGAGMFTGSGPEFMGQHSIDIISANRFYLFDNGSVGQKQANSSVVLVSIDPEAREYKVKTILGLPDSLSTVRMGSVKHLNDRMLISVFNRGFHILEIDDQGSLKSHMYNPDSYAIKVLPAPLVNYH